MSSHYGFARDGSSGYWDTDTWDPDSRVYVGASDGQNHALHMDCKSGASFWDAMAGDVDCSVEQQGIVPPNVVNFSTQYAVATSAPTEPATSRWQACDSNGYPMAKDRSAHTSERQPAVDVSASIPTLPRRCSVDNYWNAGSWVTGRTTVPLGKSQRKLSAAASSFGGEAKRGMMIVEPNSNAYWETGQWDPDERVYVGAAVGERHHLQAVDLTDVAGFGLQLSQVWAGGLVSADLGLSTVPGRPVDLMVAAVEARPTLKDEYEIFEETVGSGSFGVVRKARHRTTGKKCALKAVNKTQAGDLYRHNLIDGCLGETLLRMSKNMPHDNVAKYLDILEGPSHFYVIMEELDGPELLEHMEEQFPITESLLRRVMRQVLASLEHLHDAVGLYHRDVKLANFRFRGHSDKSSLVLLDFGFASQTSEPWDGAVCGTTMFMAPELLAREVKLPYLPAVDLWAAGVVLFVLLTGDAPMSDQEVKLFSQPEKKQELDGIMRRTFANKDLTIAPPQPVDLLGKLLVLDPKERTTAANALSHQWITDDDSNQTMWVSRIKYRAVRSNSRMSENRKPPPSRRLSNAPSRSSSRNSVFDGPGGLPSIPFDNKECEHE